MTSELSTDGLLKWYSWAFIRFLLLSFHTCRLIPACIIFSLCTTKKFSGLKLANSLSLRCITKTFDCAWFRCMYLDARFCRMYHCIYCPAYAAFLGVRKQRQSLSCFLPFFLSTNLHASVSSSLEESKTPGLIGLSDQRWFGRLYFPPSKAIGDSNPSFAGHFNGRWQPASIPRETHLI